MLLAGTGASQAGDLCADMAAAIKTGAPFPLRPEFFPSAMSKSVEFWKTKAITGDLPVKASPMPSRDRLLAEAKPLGSNTLTVMSWILAKSDKDPIFTTHDEAAAYTQVPVGNLIGLMADVPGGGEGASRWAFVYLDGAKVPHMVASPAGLGGRDVDRNDDDNAVLTQWQGTPVFVETVLAFYSHEVDEQARVNVTPWLGDHFGATCHVAVSANTAVHVEPSLLTDSRPQAQWIRTQYRRWLADAVAFIELPPEKRPAYQAEVFRRFAAGGWLEGVKLDAMLRAINADRATRLGATELAIPYRAGPDFYFVVADRGEDNDASMVWTFKLYPQSLAGFGVGKRETFDTAVRERPTSVARVMSGAGAFSLP